MYTYIYIYAVSIGHLAASVETLGLDRYPELSFPATIRGSCSPNPESCSIPSLTSLSLSRAMYIKYTR